MWKADERVALAFGVCVALAVVIGPPTAAGGFDESISAQLREKVDVGVAFLKIPQGFFDVQVSLERPKDWFIVTSKDSSRFVSKSGQTIWKRTSADGEKHVWEGCGVSEYCWPGVLFAGELTRPGKGGERPSFNSSVADIDIDIDSLGLHSDEPTEHHWPPNLGYTEDAFETGEGFGGLLLPPALCPGKFPPPDWSSVPESAKEQYKALKLVLRPRWIGPASKDGYVGDLSFFLTGDTEHFALYQLSTGKLATSEPIRVPPSGFVEDYAILTGAGFSAVGSIRARFTWDSNLAGGVAATDSVRLVPMRGVLEFIRQDNAVFEKHGDDACHMVSKEVTDKNLPAVATFEGPPGADPDPETFRVQVRGMASGLQKSIKVRLDVLRGANVAFSHSFDVLEGTLAGKPAYRTNQHIRLVSNAVDDAYAGDQTPLVKVGDYVRATLLLDKSALSVCSLPVGRPPEEGGHKAIRTARVNFVTIRNCASTPEEVVDRMSRNWAQLAIRFKLESKETVTSVNNALTVAGTAEKAGTLTVTVTDPTTKKTKSVKVAFAADEEAKTVAKKLAAAINGSGFVASSYPEDGEDFSGYIVIVNRRKAVSFSNLACTDSNIKVVAHNLNLTLGIEGLDAAILGLNFKSDHARTIDVIAVPADTVDSAAGASGGEYLAKTSPGWCNTVFLSASASAPTDSSQPFIPGHEMGHVLLNGGNNIHCNDATNLMHGNEFQGQLSVVDSINATKRLDSPGTFDQNDAARAACDMDHSGLLQME